MHSKLFICVTVGLLGLIVVLSSQTDPGRSEVQPPSSDKAARSQSRAEYSPSPSPSPGLLPCTGFDESTNFTAYSVGKQFDGLPITRQERVCTRPLGGAPPDARLNIVAYSYGDCAPPPDGGCALPLEVQTWPRCERNPAEYAIDHHNPLDAKLTIRGVPAHVYEHGLRLEVYAGRSTIVIFGTDRRRVKRAAHALVEAPARPDAPIRDGDTGTPLPDPPAGPISCG